MALSSGEGFKPFLHVAPYRLSHRLLVWLRRHLDFQVLTVYRFLRRHLPPLYGTVVDVGCGEMPYRYLLPPAVTEYFGLEVQSDAVWRRRSDVQIFDGTHLPYEGNSIDAVLATEVLEHVAEPQQLIDEIHRVLRPGGKAICTVPWSARYHYIPHDYYRYTPSALEDLFSRFGEVQIEERGTDLTVIASKVIVVFIRSVLSLTRVRNWWKLPVLFALSPLFPLALLLGHLSVWLSLGSRDDPLGYGLVAEKKAAG